MDPHHSSASFSRHRLFYAWHLARLPWTSLSWCYSQPQSCLRSHLGPGHCHLFPVTSLSLLRHPSFPLKHSYHIFRQSTIHAITFLSRILPPISCFLPLPGSILRLLRYALIYFPPLL